MLTRVLVVFEPGDGPLAERVGEALIQSGFLPRPFPLPTGLGGDPASSLDTAIEKSGACVVLLTRSFLCSRSLAPTLRSLQARLPVVLLLSGDVRPSELPEALESSPLDSYSLARIGVLLRREIRRWEGMLRSREGPAREVCRMGPYELIPGRPVEIPLAAGRGDTVLGTLTEEDGDDFRWLILDERGLRRLESGAGFQAEASDEGFGSYRVRWEVPGPGPWYLVLLAPGKKGSRLVTAKLLKHGEKEGRPRDVPQA
ncbi:MAG: hypothetical protein QXH42_06160 [Thermoplasmata archaeon]